MINFQFWFWENQVNWLFVKKRNERKSKTTVLKKLKNSTAERLGKVYE